MGDFRLVTFITLTSGLTSNSDSYWDSSINIGMGYGLDSWRTRDFSVLIDSRQALGPSQPLIHRVPGVLSLGLKQQGPEADHSPPSSVEVLNGGTMPPVPLLSTWCGA
jgi:hypothetical protein